MLEGGERYVRARTIFLFCPFETKQSSNNKERKKIYIYIHMYYNTLKCLTRTHMLARISGADST